MESPDDAAVRNGAERRSGGAARQTAQDHIMNGRTRTRKQESKQGGPRWTEIIMTVSTAGRKTVRAAWQRQETASYAAGSAEKISATVIGKESAFITNLYKTERKAAESAGNRK